MKFDKDGKLFVYVKRGYENVGVLCFKLVSPTSDNKQYVIGWSTVAEEDSISSIRRLVRGLQRTGLIRYLMSCILTQTTHKGVRHCSRLDVCCLS